MKLQRLFRLNIVTNAWENVELIAFKVYVTRRGYYMNDFCTADNAITDE